MLAIITVVYRNYEVLHDFIVSLVAQSSSDYRLFIVDLTDEKERQPIPWIRKIEDKIMYVVGNNKGYAYGVNIGITNAQQQGWTHFAIVNPDIVFDKDFVRNSTHCLASNPKTIIGGKIYYAPSYEFHTKLQAIDSIPYPHQLNKYYLWYAGGTIDWRHAITKHIGVDEIDCPKYNIPSNTHFVSGCCMLYDKTVHDIVGQWDTKYFMYYEDSDYCVRATRKNVKIIYEPSIMIWHKNAQSTGGAGSNFHLQIMTKSRLRFGLRYAPIRTKLHLVKNYVFSKK